MAHSASSSRNQSDVHVVKKTLKSGATFECHRNNVFRVPADVLVVSSNGSVEACARVKVGFSDWEKNKLFRNSSIFNDWKRVFKILNCDRKPKFCFNRVYSVQVPPVDKKTKFLDKRWMNEFEKMIKKQLKEADNEKSSSITIPLLGTNAGGAPKDGCVQRFIDAVISIEKFQHLQKINLVVQDWPEFTLVQDILAKQFKNASDSEKYKNITQAKKKSHLIPSSSSSNHVSGGSKTRSRSPDELKTSNRYDISDHQSNTDGYHSGDKSRGDNAQSLLRSKSRESRSVRDSSSHSRQDDHRIDRQNSEEISLSATKPISDARSSSSGRSRPTSARDDSSIQDVPGFGLNGASGSNRDGYGGANGSYGYGVEGSSVDPPPHQNSLDSYQDAERKHRKTRDEVKDTTLDTDSKDYRHHSSKSHNRKEEDEGFSQAYAASHDALSENNRKYQRNSDDKYFSDHKQFQLQPYGEFDKERLEELKEREDSDHKQFPIEGPIEELKEREDSDHKDLNETSDESHTVKSRHQNGNLNRQGSYDKDYIKHEDNDIQGASYIVTRTKHWCINCSRDAFSKYEYPCGHVYCISCKPLDGSCVICKEVNRQPKNKDGNDDDPSNTVQNRNTKRATSTSENSLCIVCSRDAFSKLPCSHVYCIDCKPRDGCVKCEGVDAQPKNRDGNGDDSTNRVQRSIEFTNKGNLCKNCLKMTFTEMIKLPCQHFYCVFCKHYGRCCQQCPIVPEQPKNRDGNGDDSSNRVQTTIEHICEDPEGNKVQSSSEITHEDRRDKTMDEKFCHRCHSDLKNRSQNQQRCGHTFCSKCSSIGCTDVICIENPEGNKVQRSTTYEERSEKTSEKKCYKCHSSLKNRSQVQLRCGHTFCPKCSSNGCTDRICIEDPEGNKVQRSSEITHEERKDKMSEEICYRCQSSLKNNSPVQLACGHTFCARCASKGCKDPSCEEESFDDDDRPSQAESISSREISGNHSNKDSLKSDHKNNDKRMDSKNKERNYREDEMGYHSNKDSHYKSGHDYKDDRTGYHSNKDSHYKSGHDYKDDKMGYHSNRDSYKKGREDGKGDNHSSKRGQGVGREKEDQHAVGAEKAPMCAICMDDITDPKRLKKCGHVFCRKCIKDSFKLHKPVCPSCGTIYGITIGNMPAGNMNVHKSACSIEGYRKYGSYSISYTFSSGTQGKEHPNPGVMYFNTSRVAYLPANPEGIEVCKMLKVAFKRRLTFTIGRSTTTGKENVITWNDIHHKTSMNGGPTNFGYPDPTYLSRVKEELASKGVTEADIGGMSEGNETLYVR